MLLPNELFFEQVEAVLAEGQPVQIRMKGHSMRPLLRNDRDRVVVRAYGAGEEPQRGDVVLFRYKGRHVLHRIVARRGERFLLAGDGNYRLREECSRADIAGRVVQVIRPSGRTLSCDGKRWRRLSRRWLALPERLRRFLLRVLWHLGIR